jgi:ectoine hydroxylase-related dioxygenase (phytanoyl-CoA dioxygenase family)
MPKVLTEAQIATYRRDGCLWPVRAMSAERARGYRARFEALEARVPDIKKMKTKSHLLCPWVLEIAEDPHILDVFEDLIGPDIRCWTMAWRVKKADGETFAGWHQDSAYGAALPVVLGALALSDCGPRQGCLRAVPGSHRWGILAHEESDDPRSILARGQFITDAFDESKAVDLALAPGEMAMFDNTLVHGSGPNLGPDRRFLLLVEMLPTWATPPRVRQSTMLVRGADAFGSFDDEPRPDGEWTPTALANWARVVEGRARLIFEDSRIGPSEAFGGTRRAT